MGPRQFLGGRQSDHACRNIKPSTCFCFLMMNTVRADGMGGTFQHENLLAEVRAGHDTWGAVWCRFGAGCPSLPQGLKSSDTRCWSSMGPASLGAKQRTNVFPWSKQLTQVARWRHRKAAVCLHPLSSPGLGMAVWEHSAHPGLGVRHHCKNSTPDSRHAAEVA